MGEEEYPDQIHWADAEDDLRALIPELMDNTLFDEWLIELRRKLVESRPMLSEDERND